MFLFARQKNAIWYFFRINEGKTQEKLTCRIFYRNWYARAPFGHNASALWLIQIECGCLLSVARTFCCLEVFITKFFSALLKIFCMNDAWKSIGSARKGIVQRFLPQVIFGSVAVGLNLSRTGPLKGLWVVPSFLKVHAIALIILYDFQPENTNCMACKNIEYWDLYSKLEPNTTIYYAIIHKSILQHA